MADQPQGESTSPPAAAEPKPAGSGLMDFGDEEEEENGQDDLLTKNNEAAAPANDNKPKASKASNSLMDFGEEEEEDEDGDLLKRKPVKAKRKIVQEEVEEEDEEDEEEDDEDERKESSRQETRKSKSKHEEDMEVEENDEDEDYDQDDDSDYQGRTIERILIPSLTEYVPRNVMSCYYAQLPRFLYIAGGPFDEDTYNYDREKATIKQRNGDRLIGDEIVRWRIKQDITGKEVKNENGEYEIESNTRIVEYEDGTFQVFVGDEPIDLKFTQTSNEFLYGRVLDGEGEVAFESLMPFDGFASFLPSGPNSKQQRSLQALIKRQQIKAISMQDTKAEVDPEHEQDQKIKKMDEIHRKNVRRRNKAENARARGRRAMDEDKYASYLEQDDAPKSRKKRKTKSDMDEEEEDEDEEEEEMSSMDDFIAPEDEEEEEAEAEAEDEDE